MFKRDAEKELLTLTGQFKAVAVTGPRQSGKTTLVKAVFPDRPYVSLENPDTRMFVTQDPRGFLGQFNDGVIIDEAQRVPELFSYLQEVLDDSREPGRFILTGSNNFLLQENISQSLAGRIAYLNLLPFTLNELPPDAVTGLDKLIHQGCYPPLYDQPIDPKRWFANYLRTYVERDVRQLRNITDLAAFEQFVRLCAGRVGQLLNMNNLAIEVGVDNKTIAAWVGVLESSFIIFLLRPHHRNFNKRLVKMPKLYFHDTGLACALLGIREAQDLPMHSYRGALFENLVISELQKWRAHRGVSGGMYFWRNSTGNEIDLLIEDGQRITPIELKSGMTVQPGFFKGLEYWQKLSGQQEGTVIYGGDMQQLRSNGMRVIPWRAMHRIHNGV
jgi:predicted AAA+ superfamily ATPase